MNNPNSLAWIRYKVKKGTESGLMAPARSADMIDCEG